MQFKKMMIGASLALSIGLFAACGNDASTTGTKETTTKTSESRVDLNKVDLPQLNDKVTDDEYLVELVTTEGNIKIKLFPKQAPKAVENFVKHAKEGYYKDTPFHRVIENFMIQGGDPKGDGSGEPGYLFADEIVPTLKHDAPGVLSMANRGAATNGSQFFITHVATPHLDGRHTVFGKVIKGQEIVNTIEQNDVIEKVEIIRVGKEAKKFNAEKTFSSIIEKNKKEEEVKKQQAEVLKIENKKLFDQYQSKATSLPSGVKVYIAEKGTGVQPNQGEQIAFDYAGYLADGTLFDTGIEALAEKHGILNPQRKAANAYSPLNYTFGERGGFIEGMTEGLLQLKKGDKAYIFIPSALGYGERAMGPIPANSNLVFYVDIKP